VVELLEHPAMAGIGQVRVACTHGLFADGALERLAARPQILEIVSTDTVPIPAERRVDKLTVLSVAPAFAEAIRRIHNGESVSALFQPA
jgi:ribose-phosphate pyrophosphokinase